MRQAFVEAMKRMASANRKLMLITADLGFSAFEEYIEAFPGQYTNVGVAEQNMTGVATGLALATGRTVFTYSIGNFPTLRCLEQIRNDAAYHEADLKVVTMGGGFSYGSLGMSHHSTEDLGIMRSLPITVVAPGDNWEVEQAVEALCHLPGTAYLRLERAAADQVGSVNPPFEIGKARVLRQGNDVTLVATGSVLEEAWKTSERLATQGVQARVISAHTLRPFDSETIVQAARETGGIITIEEHGRIGGLASAVAESCLKHGVQPKFFQALAMDGFSAIVGTQAYLREKYGLDADAIEKAVHQRISQMSGAKA
jgi:transketolase